MKNLAIRVARALASIVVTWATVAFLHSMKTTNRSIASMALVLEVLATSTLGDRSLAIVASISAALGFSWYYVDESGSFAISTLEGELTFSMMMLTALVGSHLAIRAQQRAAEAIRRREEMERLHELGTALLGSATVGAAAQNIVEDLVKLFGVGGAVLTVHDFPLPFAAGTRKGAVESVLKEEGTRYALDLYGTMPSAEVRSALRNLIDLVLDRARTAEQQTQVQAAQRGEEFRNTVLNSLAHNFRTPLTSIKAAASILRGPRQVPEENARELAAVIDEEADRLDQMIRESLDLARIEAQQASPRLETCSLKEIVNAVSLRVARHVGGRRLSVDLPDDLPPVHGDRFLLEQMLVQVVDNAWKYSQLGAAIKLTSGVDGDGLFVEILNEGPQIPPEERDRIFAKFYRGKQTRSNVEGTGMGLAIARSIAEAHAGRLDLRPHPQGPLFRFTLPVRIGEKEEKHAHDREPQHIGR
jgi:two-component system sensor histidine kinase KdpD